MTEIQKLEKQIWDINVQLAQLRRDNKPVEVKNYTFKDLNGTPTLLDLFGDKTMLFAIHNMGQGCRYCTLWADGLNAFLPHLEEKAAVVLLSKDAPSLQRQFANSRGWRFRMASHAGTDYSTTETVTPGKANMPGMVCYVREGNKIFKKNSTEFGPGDAFCSFWSVISLAGETEETWTPQFNYWQRPSKMDDGGKNLN